MKIFKLTVLFLSFLFNGMGFCSESDSDSQQALTNEIQRQGIESELQRMGIKHESDAEITWYDENGKPSKYPSNIQGSELLKWKSHHSRLLWDGYSSKEVRDRERNQSIKNNRCVELMQIYSVAIYFRDLNLQPIEALNNIKQQIPRSALLPSAKGIINSVYFGDGRALSDSNKIYASCMGYIPSMQPLR